MGACQSRASPAPTAKPADDATPKTADGRASWFKRTPGAVSPEEEAEPPPPAQRKRASVDENKFDAHAAPPAGVLAELASRGAVVPCEHAGSEYPAHFHANVAGNLMCFKTLDAKTRYHAKHRAALAKYGSWAGIDIAKTDADWSMRYGSQVFGQPFKFDEAMKARLAREGDLMRRAYEDAARRARTREPDDYDALVSDKAYAAKTPRRRLRQRSDDVSLIYADALAALPELWFACAAAVAAADAKAAKLSWCVKKLLRAHEKLVVEYAGKAGQLLDVARVSVVCGSVAELRRVFGQLLKNKGVVRVKNRFAKPAGGYVDVLLNWTASKAARGHVCEIQLHAASVYATKGEGGHQSYKWLRRLVRADDSYEGPSAPGRPHGEGGRKLFAAGDAYVGAYVHGEKHGAGRYVSSDGTVFEGSYVKDRRHGPGVVRYANGNVFEGSYVDGVIEGHGTKRVYGGGVYVGAWKHGKPDGRGTDTSKTGDVYYVGDFRAGKKSGKGVVTYGSGDAATLDGDFVDDRPVKGTLTYADGAVFVGDLDEEGLPKHGVLTGADGATYDGRFRKGRPLLRKGADGK
ncbi:hypothetical protein JL721_6179 [Aureococcus anophagefferens]|nr:hypothetical protein JL721_6179 [Aureococcus anophagefferens]